MCPSSVTRKVALTLALTGSLILTACGGGGGGGNSTPTPSGSGIGPEGGVATSSDGKAKVTVPAGALTQTTEVTVSLASNTGSGYIGSAYDFGPDGTTFQQPVTITLSYDDAAVSSGTNEADLRLGTLVNNVWQEVAGSTVDTGSNTVTGATMHFSVYGSIAVTSSSGVPAAPAGVSATASDSSITISWAPVSGAESYNLYMATQDGVSRGNYGSLAGGMQHLSVTSPYNHTDLTNGTTYYFVVTALNANGESAESLEVSATPEPHSYSGTFLGTGSMYTGRASHTATLLPNGSVLILYGSASPSTGAVPELYNAATGHFTRLGGGVGPDRSGNTATLLPNGKVLVTGGTTGSVVLNAALLYDYGSGTSTNTGSMAVARTGHTATLLPNGKVLIVGGAGINNMSAELYDPTTGVFTATGSLTIGRSNHTATLLPNGKVLIVGGDGTQSTELYDPTTGAFTVTGSVALTRTRHTATLLQDGRVLIAGGGLSASAEVYDPTTGVFTATGSMAISRTNHTATLLPNGKVLVVGGIGSASSELYDPGAGSFTSSGSMSIDRSGHTAALLPNDMVLIAGGGSKVTSQFALSSAELFQ